MTFNVDEARAYLDGYFTVSLRSADNPCPVATSPNVTRTDTEHAAFLQGYADADVHEHVTFTLPPVCVICGITADGVNYRTNPGEPPS